MRISTIRKFPLSIKRYICICCQSQRMSSIFHTPKKFKKPHNRIADIEDNVFQYAGDTIEKQYRCYVWGYAATGALGKKSYLQPLKPTHPVKRIQKYPQHLTDFYRRKLEVTHAGCGYGFTIFGVKDDRNRHFLYGTGINTDAQIGFHIESKKEYRKYLVAPLPIAVPVIQPDRIKYTHLAAGRAHSIIVTDEEGVFSLGNNAHGQCCRPIIEDEIYRGSQLIHKLQFNKEIHQVVCGQDHTLIVTTDGEVYSCGLSADGQTGLGHYEATDKLTKVKGDIDGVKIVHVSCKADCVLAVSEDGDVFGWGNSEYNQLDCVAMGDTQVYTPVRLPFGNIVGKVKRVAAGGSTCALINEEGDVYVWGYGILGKGPNIVGSPVPSKIPEAIFGRTPVNANVKVEDIAAGINFFLAKTNYGDIYSWGRNKTGALGLGHMNDQFFPFKVQIPGDVKAVYCGVDHAIAISRTFS